MPCIGENMEQLELSYMTVDCRERFGNIYQSWTQQFYSYLSNRNACIYSPENMFIAALFIMAKVLKHLQNPLTAE